MAEQQIHELAQIVAISGSTLLVVSDGATTYKGTVSQIPIDLPVRTTADPVGLEGSIRANSYNPASAVGWDPSGIGRSGIAWKDSSFWNSILDARDMGRRLYRRLVTSTATSYTLTETDIQYGITIIFSGTDAKSISVPAMTTTSVPTTALPSHGAIGVARTIRIIQASSGVITLSAGTGLSNLYGTTTTNGDNSTLELHYDTTTEARAWRFA